MGRKDDLSEEKAQLFDPRAFQAKAGWDKETFRDFPTCVYWVRQVIAPILGVVWGIIPLQGIVGHAAFFIVSMAIMYL